MRDEISTRQDGHRIEATLGIPARAIGYGLTPTEAIADCAADARRLGIVVACGCGRTFTAAEWAELPLAGRTNDGVWRIELRNCSCGSTRSRAWCVKCTAEIGQDGEHECPRVTICMRCGREHDGACDVDPVLAAAIARATSAPDDFLAKLERAFAQTFGASR